MIKVINFFAKYRNIDSNMKLSALRRGGPGVLAKANNRPEPKLQPVNRRLEIIFLHFVVKKIIALFFLSSND